MSRRIPLLLGFVLFATATVHAVPARAVADGPAFWAVTGVAYNDALNIRAQPNARSRILGVIPPNGRMLPNLGCTGIPTIDEYARMTRAQQARAGENRWCLTRYGAVKGWVRGKFLTEGE